MTAHAAEYEGSRHRVETWVTLTLLVFACVSGCGERQSNENGGEPINRSAVIAGRIAESQGYLDQYDDTDQVPLIGLADGAAQQAVGTDSTTLALLQLARVRMVQNYYDEAATLAGRVLIESRYDAEAWGIMGDAFLYTGHYRDADSCYHLMYEIDDGFHSLLRLAGRDELYGHFDDAIAGLDRAIAGAKTWASGRDLATAYARLAAIFFAHGYMEAAMQNIDESLSQFPGVVPRLGMKAEMLRVSGQTTEAITILSELTERSGNPVYMASLARLYRDQGKENDVKSVVAAALEEFSQLELEYHSVIARPYVEFLLAFKIDQARALEMAFALSRHQRDIYGYELLAWAYYKNEQYDRAWSSISLALRREATDPRVLYRAALIARANGMEDKYRAFEKRALEANPLATVMYDG